MIINKELNIKNKGQRDASFFDRLLSARNIQKKDLDKEFFFSPFLMNDMDLVVERVVKSIKDKEKILIYGDYDGGATRF